MPLQEQLTKRKEENIATFPEEIKNVLLGDLEKHNGEEQFDVPLPATYVVETDETIRAEPADVVNVLQSLVK